VPARPTGGYRRAPARPTAGGRWASMPASSGSGRSHARQMAEVESGREKYPQNTRCVSWEQNTQSHISVEKYPQKNAYCSPVDIVRLGGAPSFRHAVAWQEKSQIRRRWQKLSTLEDPCCEAGTNAEIARLCVCLPRGQRGTNIGYVCELATLETFGMSNVGRRRGLGTRFTPR